MATVEAGDFDPLPVMLGPPTVELRRGDPGPQRDELVLRFRIDDRNQVIKNALGHWHEYETVLNALGRSGSGALVLSAFALRDGWTADGIAAHDRLPSQPRPRVHVRGAVLLDHNALEIWATSMTTPDGELDPRNNVHYDVVVTTDEDLVTPSLLATTKSERSQGRDRIRPVIAPILDLWN